MYRTILKPLFDRVFAAILIILLIPLMLTLAIIVLLLDGSPVMFVQERSGYGMNRFLLFKFRSLVPDGIGGLSMHYRKLTKTGRLLRVSGLDELPQLWNILFGEMSFVGPRPLPVEYNQKYREEHQVRFAVKPGITGWAQVNGRNGVSWEERFQMDAWYVQHQSLWLDLKICILTIVQFFKFHNEKTMPVFNGSN